MYCKAILIAALVTPRAQSKFQLTARVDTDNYFVMLCGHGFQQWLQLQESNDTQSLPTELWPQRTAGSSWKDILTYLNETLPRYDVRVGAYARIAQQPV